MGYAQLRFTSCKEYDQLGSYAYSRQKPFNVDHRIMRIRHKDYYN